MSHYILKYVSSVKLNPLKIKFKYRTNKQTFFSCANKKKKNYFGNWLSPKRGER